MATSAGGPMEDFACAVRREIATSHSSDWSRPRPGCTQPSWPSRRVPAVATEAEQRDAVQIAEAASQCGDPAKYPAESRVERDQCMFDQLTAKRSGCGAGSAGRLADPTADVVSRRDLWMDSGRRLRGTTVGRSVRADLWCRIRSPGGHSFAVASARASSHDIRARSGLRYGMRSFGMLMPSAPTSGLRDRRARRTFARRPSRARPSPRPHRASTSDELDARVVLI